MYKYSAFGISISSEFSFPELIQREEDQIADLNIIYGDIPDCFDETNMISPGVWINQDKYLIKIDNVAEFYAEKRSSYYCKKI